VPEKETQAGEFVGEMGQGARAAVVRRAARRRLVRRALVRKAVRRRVARKAVARKAVRRRVAAKKK
jgi:hypothetical protein